MKSKMIQMCMLIVFSTISRMATAGDPVEDFIRGIQNWDVKCPSAGEVVEGCKLIQEKLLVPRKDFDAESTRWFTPQSKKLCAFENVWYVENRDIADRQVKSFLEKIKKTMPSMRKISSIDEWQTEFDPKLLMAILQENGKILQNKVQYLERMYAVPNALGMVFSATIIEVKNVVGSGACTVGIRLSAWSNARCSLAKKEAAELMEGVSSYKILGKMSGVAIGDYYEPFLIRMNAVIKRQNEVEHERTRIKDFSEMPQELRDGFQGFLGWKIGSVNDALPNCDLHVFSNRYEEVRLTSDFSIFTNNIAKLTYAPVSKRLVSIEMEIQSEKLKSKEQAALIKKVINDVKCLYKAERYELPPIDLPYDERKKYGVYQGFEIEGNAFIVACLDGGSSGAVCLFKVENREFRKRMRKEFIVAQEKAIDQELLEKAEVKSFCGIELGAPLADAKALAENYAPHPGDEVILYQSSCNSFRNFRDTCRAVISKTSKQVLEIICFSERRVNSEFTAQTLDIISRHYKKEPYCICTESEGEQVFAGDLKWLKGVVALDRYVDVGKKDWVYPLGDVLIVFQEGDDTVKDKLICVDLNLFASAKNEWAERLNRQKEDQRNQGRDDLFMFENADNASGRRVIGTLGYQFGSPMKRPVGVESYGLGKGLVGYSDHYFDGKKFRGMCHNPTLWYTVTSEKLAGVSIVLGGFGAFSKKEELENIDRIISELLLVQKKIDKGAFRVIYRYETEQLCVELHVSDMAFPVLSVKDKALAKQGFDEATAAETAPGGGESAL